MKPKTSLKMLDFRTCTSSFASKRSAILPRRSNLALLRDENPIDNFYWRYSKPAQHRSLPKLTAKKRPPAPGCVRASAGRIIVEQCAPFSPRQRVWAWRYSHRRSPAPAMPLTFSARSGQSSPTTVFNATGQIPAPAWPDYVWTARKPSLRAARTALRWCPGNRKRASSTNAFPRPRQPAACRPNSRTRVLIRGKSNC